MIRAAKNPVGEALVWGLIRNAVTQHFSAVHARWRVDASPDPSSPSLHTTLPAAFRDLNVSQTPDLPTIFCPNHSNWFDGYLCLVLARKVIHHEPYLMMEERNLARYRFFTWAGVFGVDRDDARAAVASLDYAADLLRGHPERGMYIFPQGTMVPNERRPLHLYSGAARLAQRVGRVRVVPVAFRYEFLQEQRPEAFMSLGPSRVVTKEDSPRAVTAWLSDAITAELDALTTDVVAERLASFTTVMQGRGGIDRAFDRLASRERRESRRLAREDVNG